MTASAELRSSLASGGEGLVKDEAAASNRCGGSYSIAEPVVPALCRPRKNRRTGRHTGNRRLVAARQIEGEDLISWIKTSCSQFSANCKLVIFGNSVLGTWPDGPKWSKMHCELPPAAPDLGP
jgi:hypothetical protein